MMQDNFLLINAKIPHVNNVNAIEVKNGKIVWIGNILDVNIKHKKIIDAKNKLVTPVLIDCHTHLIFAGDRFSEFAMRQNGVSYEEISQMGGGIWSTVLATRKATENELYELALERVAAFIQEGVATIEVKSGYGLDFASEMKILRVATRLKEDSLATIQRTFLGAHAIPKEYIGNADQYINDLCNKFLPEIKKQKLADAVDVFCENIAFNTKHVKKLFSVAQALGFPVKIHAEQLTHQGGTQLAAKFSALSADHLEYAQEKDVIALKQSKTVAVLLPSASYFLRETKKPPITLFRKHNVPMAVSTDLNPGTSPINSLLTTAHFAMNIFGLTINEVFDGVTINAAKALGLEKEIGSIEVDKKADIVVWNVRDLNELFFGFGLPHKKMVVKEGKVVYDTLNFT